MMMALAGFVFCAALIFQSGRRLSHYGDKVAGLLGWSRGWVGLVLMATVTSLPELLVGISSAAWVGSADLAAGDIFGSCALNMAILEMLDALVPGRKPLTGVVAVGHALHAALGAVLLSLAGLALFVSQRAPVLPWVGLSSVGFVLAYMVAVRLMHAGERRAEAPSVRGKDGEPAERGTVLPWFAFHALVIVVAALALPQFAERIAQETGLGRTFVGTLLLAASTSLPELAVSAAAVRMGNIDMAVGNLLGSNVFNILILALDDLFYTRGTLLADASPVHLISVLCTLMMSAVLTVGLLFHPAGKRFLLAWDALTILLIYLGNMVLLYRLGA